MPDWQAVAKTGRIPLLFVSQWTKARTIARVRVLARHRRAEVLITLSSCALLVDGGTKMHTFPGGSEDDLRVVEKPCELTL